MKAFQRIAISISAMIAAALAGIAVRDAHLAGLFTRVTPGFAGSCNAIGPIAGAGDLQIDTADGLVFIAANDRRSNNARDGIYAMTLAGSGLTRLAGAPANFHPRAISMGGAPGGPLTLMAVNYLAGGKPAVDIFDVTVAGGEAKLSQRASIEGGLLTHPSAIVATGPDSFYVANETTGTGLAGRLLNAVMAPRGAVVYFNGEGLRLVANGINRADGLALSPDGAHLIVAAAGQRALLTYETNLLTGALTPVDTLALAAGPDQITVDPGGRLWVAGHPDLLAQLIYAHKAASPAQSQIFEVAAPGGIPRDPQTVYADTGSGIGAASVGAVSGKSLIIGSALDDKILACTLR